MNLYEDQGFTAYNSGQLLEDCSYTEDTEEHQDWMKGWCIARDLSETSPTHKLVNDPYYYLATLSCVI